MNQLDQDRKALTDLIQSLVVSPHEHREIFQLARHRVKLSPWLKEAMEVVETFFQTAFDPNFHSDMGEDLRLWGIADMMLQATTDKPSHCAGRLLMWELENRYKGDNK